MAADLATRAAALLLSGDERGRAVLMGAAATMRADVRYCTDRYRTSLIAAGLCLAGESAAVAAILCGEHPADSLPGQVEKMYDAAFTATMPPSAERSLFDVLALLGVEP